MSTGYVLTFHSHNVSGTTYDTNEHVALDESLDLIESLGLPVLRLIDVVRHLRARTFARLPGTFVCLTLDDGSDYDWKPVRHPEHGMQEPMARIVKRHRRSFLGITLRNACATSFVIASADARREIADGDKPYRLSEDWWADAQASGFFDIGSHGWNHVHPAVSEMEKHPELIEAFDKVGDAQQADLQIGAAGRYIRARAGAGAARLFAYPYGQVSDYLAERWFPAQDDVWAAFTTENRPLSDDYDIWRLPRFVCGWHWKNRDDLRAILNG